MKASNSEDVLKFWFEELSPKDHFMGGQRIDEVIRSRFSALHESAKKGECYHWRATPRGRLAETIVLDQFSRNLFRGTAHAFSQDAMALALAQEAVTAKADQALSLEQREFIYMPFMHSESLIIHEEAVRLFSQPGHSEGLKYELRHLDILKRFGRYPHRNASLGRTSTPDEIEFLKQPGSSF